MFFEPRTTARTEPAIPLVDLHRHLEGSLRPETVLELTEVHGLDGPRHLEEVRQRVQVSEPLPSLIAYLERNDRAVEALADLDACARVAFEAVADAAAEGLAYLELRFSPWFMARPHGLDPREVVGAVVDGARRGERQSGLRTSLIGILSRTFGPDGAERELDALLIHQHDIVALDLAGDEARWPGERFESHFRRAREAGWRVTVHAGEAGGPRAIRHAVEVLGAERVGHGVRAVEDSAVIDLLAERRIGLEVSLTSNAQTGTFPDLSLHPLRRLMEHGIPAAICTDNPTASATTLAYELTHAAPAAGLSAVLVERAQHDAIAMAFADVPSAPRSRDLDADR